MGLYGLTMVEHRLGHIRHTKNLRVFNSDQMCLIHPLFRLVLCGLAAGRPAQNSPTPDPARYSRCKGMFSNEKLRKTQQGIFPCHQKLGNGIPRTS